MRFNEVLVWVMNGLEIKNKAHGGSMKVMRVHEGHRGSMMIIKGP